MDLTIESIVETQRLISISSLHTELKKIILESDFSIRNGVIGSAPLCDLLRINNTSEKFFRMVENNECVLASLVQFLLIHYSITNDKPDISTIENLRVYIEKEDRFRYTFIHWTERAKFVIYIEHFNLATWSDYAIQSNGDWAQVHLLEGSLPYCEASLDGIFSLIVQASKENPGDWGLHFLGSNLILKLKLDSVLRSKLDSSIEQVFSNDSLRSFLPSFLKGIIHDNANVFQQQLDKLITNFGESYPFQTLYALGSACPENDTCVRALKKSADLIKEKLSAAEYLNIINLVNIITDDVIKFAVELSASSENYRELTGLIDMLINNIDRHINDKWYKNIAENLIKSPIPEMKEPLNRLLNALSEKKLKWVYELLTIRFSSSGNHAIPEAISVIVPKNREIFRQQLTEWFNLENSNIHRTMLYLCMADGLSPDDFKFSAERLNMLKPQDKLYIGYKIAGYVYSYKHLQSLMFSLVESVKADEKRILMPIFNIFSEYIIYNYRSTLDTIKSILKAKSMPEHLLAFYTELDQHYEKYFQQLKQAKPFIELQGDAQLIQYVQFYTQQKFSTEFSNAQEKGISSLFRKTLVHSHRWALRRPGEKVHMPNPLGHIQTSMEFPAGEKINPISNESTRYTYQRLKKNEINFN